MTELAVGGVLMVGIIVGLVQLAKFFGMPDDWAPVLNMVLTLIACIVVAVSQIWPQTEPAITFVLQFLVLFLVNAGFYSTAKFTLKKARETQAPPADAGPFGS